MRQGSPRRDRPAPASPRGKSPTASPSSPKVRRGSASEAAPASQRSPARPKGARPPVAPGARRSFNGTETERSSDGGECSTARSAESTDESAAPTSRGPAKKKGKKEGESRVLVAVRVRPAVRDAEMAEEGQGGGPAILCKGGTLWLVDGGGGGDGPSTPRGAPASPRPGSAGGGGSGPRQFVFDWALPPEANQHEVYAATCGETSVISGVLEGVNGCVMCYGQTGAGKTFTLGNVDAGSEGIMHRALTQILGAPAEPGISREVQLSCVQIYMEVVHDLINPDANVELREDPNEGFVLSGHTTEPVASVEQALDLIEAANRHRVTAATSMNDSSSRSHSVVLLDVRSRVGSKTLRGKLHLVDLAGSERVKKSEVSGRAFDEACFINNSLTCLGRCIAALAAQGKGGVRPPFRETKLTRLLSSAFGGRANTVLVVCAAPSRSDAYETLNSLQFGQQAMNVKVQARVNATVDMKSLEDELFSQYVTAQIPHAAAEAAAWAALTPAWAALQNGRRALQAERERGKALAAELQSVAERTAAAQHEADARGRAADEHARRMAALSEQAEAVRAQLQRVRDGGDAAAAEVAAEVATAAAAEVAAADAASNFGSKFLREGAARQAEERGGGAAGMDDGPDDGAEEEQRLEEQRLEEKVERFQNAVEMAWGDVQRLEEERQQLDQRYEATRREAEHLDREKEEMEATLHDVAADLGRLALVYRSEGKAPHAVPLYMTALAIYEKTLGPDHPEVAKDLVNLGNAFCDQNQHADAVPLYLRALAIDQAALGDDHPEVAMDLSNLGIVYRVQGRVDEATALFQRAHAIMLDALGPDDPKTQTVARNLAATVATHEDVPVAGGGGGGARAVAEQRSTPPPPRAEEEGAPAPAPAPAPRRRPSATALAQPLAEANDGSSDGPPAPPKLKLNMAPPTSSSGAPATPRSTYSRATAAAAAAAKEAKGGKGAGAKLLRKYVEKNREPGSPGSPPSNGRSPGFERPVRPARPKARG